MTERVSAIPYQIPESFANMTIHYLYGLTEAIEGQITDSYLTENGFALLADLMASGISKEDIEGAVNSGSVRVAHWPNREPMTDFFWKDDEASIIKLTKLADQAVQFCYGRDEHQPIGGNFATVGAEMGSQQLAIAGLIYAREQGRLREMPELSDNDAGTGPLYIVRGSFSSKMFDQLMPEETE